MQRWVLAWGAILGATLSISCDRPETDQRKVVLYTSIDRPTAEVVIKAFETQTGIQILLVTDSEATKTAGLAARLQAEAANPQADVWWSNEIFHTIALAKQGVLAPHQSPESNAIQPLFRDPNHRWASSGLRARVIGVTDATGGEAAARIQGLDDLTAPALKGRIAMAMPQFGTTGGHVAAIYLARGEQGGDKFFQALRANEIKLLGGNSVVADQVGAGQMWAGLTDNDDVTNTQSAGGKIRAILPDQRDAGTLLIPTTIALVTGSSHPSEAKALVDFLLTPRVEQILLERNFAAYSVRGDSPVTAMKLDYDAAAQLMPSAVKRALSILQDRPLEPLSRLDAASQPVSAN